MTNLNSNERMAFLAKKWQENTISEEEMREFEIWYHSFDNIYEIESDENYELLEKRLYHTILQKAGITKQKSISKWYRVAAASVVLLLASLAVFYSYQSITSTSENNLVNKNSSEALADENKATLILADGKRISLTNANVGEISNEYGVKIEKSKDGQLVYTVTDNNSANANSYNTIETPLGGNYQVNLPDGSKVWLNAASRLKYPVSFSGNERIIELTGEAYFEVAKLYKDKVKRPFIVKTKTQDVEVLGTQFNISAYDDDNKIETTLLEGSVKVTSNAENGNSISKILNPGEMAMLNLRNSNIYVSTANVRSVMAWKKGYFVFDNENIKDIMKKLSRWYDIEVEYQGDMDGVDFQANYMRSRSLENLLKTLELTNKVKFKIEGRRVTVIGESRK